MNLKEYFKKTNQFNCYPADNMKNCLIMGLISEVGEIADKVKKNHRDHNSVITEEFKKNIAYEIGDVCWYLSELNDNFFYSDFS